MSILVGCCFIQRAQKPIKLYEGQERSSEELALLNFCVVIGRPFPGRVTVKIDGKDAITETYYQASDRARYWGALSCRARILPGEHRIYYEASGSAWPGSSFEGVVNFEAGKTYYFIHDDKETDWLQRNRRTTSWLEDDDGNVLAGTKTK
jgi:hypothetical protein